jgi:predicted amidohydrolase YtcJ
MAHRGPGTRVVDAGGSVTPDFIKSHMHLFSGASELDQLHPFGVRGADALGAVVRSFAAERPQQPLLVAQGADCTLLPAPVTRHDPDRILPSRSATAG